MLYSFETCGFYSRNIHGDAIPADAVELSQQEYSSLMDGLSKGKIISRGDDGRPQLVSIPASREDIEQSVWWLIKAERERRTLTGGYQVNGFWFHSDQLSRDQQLKLRLAGADVPSVQWKTMSGEFVQMTPGLASAIVLASGESDIAIFAAAEAHRAAMLASPDPAAYDYSQGWPLTYDEWAAQQEA